MATQSKKLTPFSTKKRVLVTGTEASKYLVTGKEYPVSPKVAEKLVKKGDAKLKK